MTIIRLIPTSSRKTLSHLVIAHSVLILDIVPTIVSVPTFASLVLVIPVMATFVPPTPASVLPMSLLLEGR